MEWRSRSSDHFDPKMVNVYGMQSQVRLHPHRISCDRLKNPLCGQVCDSNFLIPLVEVSGVRDLIL